MTQREIENEIYDQKYHIADKFKDIQMQGNALKNPEDEGKNKQTLIKIKDAIDDILRAYAQITELEITVPDDTE